MLFTRHAADRSKTQALKREASAQTAQPRQGQAPRSIDPAVRLRGVNMRKSVAALTLTLASGETVNYCQNTCRCIEAGLPRTL